MSDSSASVAHAAAPPVAAAATTTPGAGGSLPASPSSAVVQAVPAAVVASASAAAASLAASTSAPPLKPAHKTKSSSAQAHLAAGFVSGLTSSVLLQPLDLLKTRVQQQTYDTSRSKASAAAAGAAKIPHAVAPKSLLATVREIDSVAALWRGTAASAIRTSVGSALYLTMLNATRTYLANSTASSSTSHSSSKLPKLTMYANLASGAAVRGVVGFITMPVTVVKVRYESSLFAYTSLGHAVRDIYAHLGVAGFFKGWGVTFLRDAPNAGLYVLFYEMWKDILSKSALLMGVPTSAEHHQQQQNARLFNTSTSALINSSSAVLSAGMATTITGPFDTIKTRVQLDPVRYTSVWKTVRVIVAEEGARGLFDGLSLRMARKAMSAGISWCIYEELVRRM